MRIQTIMFFVLSAACENREQDMPVVSHFQNAEVAPEYKERPEKYTNRLEEKPEPQTQEAGNCEGVLGNFEPLSNSKHSFSLNGKWAVGELLDGGQFVPLLYFRTHRDALRCTGDELKIRKFSHKTGTWGK
jgi:hypothetical protein